MVEAVRKYNRVFQTGSQQRSMAANRHGCELIRNGRIGKVHTVIAHNYPSPWECSLPAQPVPDRARLGRVVRPDRAGAVSSRHFTPRAKPGWISFRPYSGGEMTGWGAHGLDQVQWALGMDDSGPVEVWIEGDKVRPAHLHRAARVDGRGNAQCSHAEGLLPLRQRHRREAGQRRRPAGRSSSARRARSRIDRDLCKVDPVELADEPLQDTDAAPARERQPHAELARLHQSRADGRSPTWRSATARPRSATWATSPAGSAANLPGTRSKRSSPTTPRPTSISDRPMRKPYELPETV